MNLNTLLKLYNDLTQLNKEYPVVVLYDKQMGVIFRQLGKVVSIPYFRNYYFPKTKLKLGVLTPTGYVELMQNLQKLIEDQNIRDNDVCEVAGDYCIKFYKCYSSIHLDGPQLFAEINLVTIKKKWLSKIYLKYSGPETITLLKAILHEERTRKGNKSIQVTSTT